MHLGGKKEKGGFLGSAVRLLLPAAKEILDLGVKERQIKKRRIHRVKFW